MMKNTDESPIFIVGTPRSGTTLTAKILGQHPRLFMPGETHYFLDIYSRKKEIGDLNDEVSRDLLWQRLIQLYDKYNEPDDQKRIDRLLLDRNVRSTLKKSLNSYNDIIRVFMEMQMESLGKQRWGNNAPKDIFYINEIKELFPDAKFIICVRDARDFLGSYKSKWKATADDQVDRLKKLYHPLITSLLWKASMRLVPAIKKEFADDVFVLPYERLVQEPSVAINDICKFIQEPYNDEMLDIAFSNSSGSESNSGIFSSSVGAWESRLSHEECWFAQKVAGQEMKQLGYKLVDVDVGLFRLIWLYVTAPIALWKGLQANKENTGPVIPYLMKRVASLLKRTT